MKVVRQGAYWQRRFKAMASPCEILVEGEMPGTTSKYGRGRSYHAPQPTTFLRIIEVGLGEFRNERSVSYNVVPKKWLAEMRAQDMDWIGMGQRMIKPLPFPRTLKHLK